MLSMAFCPLWWSAFSERFGRRKIYLLSFLLFILSNVLGAHAKSIGVLIGMRLLSGAASSSGQTIGAGVIADVWEPKERGKAMGVFWLGPLCGPLISPIIGGALSQEWNWRSILWFLALYGAVTTLLILVALPETHTKRGNLDIKEPVKQPGLNLVKILLLDPLKTLRYLSRPPVLLTVYYASITYCFLFMMNISIENTFQKDPYRFSIIITGLLYIPNALGYIVASILGGRWMDYIMKREARKSERYDEDGGLIYHPEDRVRENAWLAAFLYPAGLLWYGWTADRGVAWPIPVSLLHSVFSVIISEN
jgi:multidrug resistance protein